MKNRVMLIGGIDAGKTTLTDALLKREKKPKKLKTQSLTYDDWIVDTPGEYTENPLHYRNLMATSMEITHVLFLQDATNKKTIFAPGFSSGINKLVIGVISKVDHQDADAEIAIQILKKALVKGPIVIASAYTGQGIKEIIELVKMNSMQEMKEYVETADSEHIFFHEM
ncbi:EutP/PduV family microcompartment system protein [Oceanobacillus sp. CAU 1775]